MWTKPEIIPSVKEIPSGNGYYHIPDLGVYYNTYPIKNADPETFRCDLDFAKDSHKCNRMGEVFKAADPASFEVLNVYFAKDQNHIFNIGGIDKKVDYETFEVLDPGFRLDEDGQRSKTTSYAKDKNGLWMMEYYSYKPTAVKGVDPTSFKPLNSSYAKDSKHVIWRGKRLKKANAQTFLPLNGNFGKDDKNVFFQEDILEHADLETFSVVENNMTIAFDKKSYFRFSSEISKDEFDEEKLEIKRKV